MTTLIQKPLPIFKELYKTHLEYRIYVLVGGRFSGKSYAIADVFTNLFEQRERVQFMVTRHTASSAKKSAWPLIKNISEDKGFSRMHSYYESDLSIHHKINDNRMSIVGLQEFNIDKVKSFENLAVVWMEEANYMTKNTFMAIFNTLIRTKNFVLFISFNPQYETDYVYDRFILNEDPNACVIKANYDTNYYLEPAAFMIAEAEKKRDYESYKHHYLGYPKTNEEKKYIASYSIQNAVDRYKNNPLEIDINNTNIPIVVGVDTSYGGVDRTCVAVRQGGAFKLYTYIGKNDDIGMMGDFVLQILEQYQTEHIFIDAGGGSSSGILQHLKYNWNGTLSRGKNLLYVQGKARPYRKKIADGIVDPTCESEKYYNLRCQLWGRMKDWIQTEALFDNSCQEVKSLISEIQLMQFHEDDRFKYFRLANKKQLYRNVGRKSPDLADALSFTFFMPDERLTNLNKTHRMNRQTKTITYDFDRSYVSDRWGS